MNSFTFSNHADTIRRSNFAGPLRTKFLELGPHLPRGGGPKDARVFAKLDFTVPFPWELNRSTS